jgi:hypothetical protein
MMEDLDFKSKALMWRFWELLSRFFKLPNKFKGTIRDFAIELDFSISDGFFYTKVLPVLEKNKILVYNGEENKFGYLGRFGKIYVFNRDELSKFFIKNNPITRRVFRVWILDGDVDADWIH